MRVVYVCTDPGVPVFGSKGPSVHVQAILTQLVERGDEVHLVAARTGGVPVEALASVQVHRLPRVHHESASDRELAARAADAQVGRILGRLHAVSPIGLVYERYALWGEHAMRWASRRGVPCVLEVNAPLPLEQARHRVLVDAAGADAVARSACAAADVVVCVSDAVNAWVRSLDVARPDAVHTVPNGVDTRRFAPRTVRPAPDTFTVGFVGTLKPWHGVDDLVRAFHLLHRHDPSYRLLVVGDGPERTTLQAMVADLGLDDAVEFTGAVDPTRIPDLLARMDVAVAPYPRLDEFYFSPLKLYEYLAAGVPVVAGDAGNLPELLAGPDGPLGITYPAGSVDDLAATIALLRAGPELRADLARRGRADALDSHDWSQVLAHVLGLLEVRHGAVPA